MHYIFLQWLFLILPHGGAHFPHLIWPVKLLLATFICHVLFFQVCYSGDYSSVRLQLLALWPQDCPSTQHQVTMTITPGNTQTGEEKKAASGCGRDNDEPQQKSDRQTDGWLPEALKPSSCDNHLWVAMVMMHRNQLRPQMVFCDTTETSNCSSASGLAVD